MTDCKSISMLTHRTLYLVGCAAPPVRSLEVPIDAAHRDGWDVCVVLTPSAYRWAVDDTSGEIRKLRDLTGHPIRYQYKLPSEDDVLPPATAILVAPLTANTLNKWAAGIADTLALGLITEAIGLRVPIVALPHWNEAQSRHPAVNKSIANLRDAGVDLVFGDRGCAPQKPDSSVPFPWHAAIDALS